ncbi:MAG: hypothetical protein MUF40_05840 [Gemmatimonadaceae bacterium]|nr:hypothetical protein [Gemmatimonadaceae bacterium]
MQRPLDRRRARAFVPGADLVPSVDGAMVEGTYDAATRTMLIAESVAWDAATVRLLMLQALVGRDRVSRVDAYERCASVVRCEFGCAREAGAIPVNGDASDALGIDTIAPSRLRIDAVVTPGTVSRRAGIEFVRLVVSVTNPTPRAVRVMVPPSGDAGPPGGFGYAIEYGGGSGGGWSDERLWDRAQVTFAPGETKRWSFDLRVPRMPVGTHALVGSFSRGLEAPAVTVRVDP